MMGIGTQEPQVRAGCYCRISSDPDDKREGVTRQREDTAALCEVKGWVVAGYYEDNDRSASSGKDRPEWDRLLADIKAGKIDAIAAWDQDRGWRMMSELEQLRKFFNDLGRRVLLATTGQGDIDLYSPTGVMMAQVKTAVSEHEIAMMRVRQKRAGRQRAEQGRPKWREAFGYLPYEGRKEDDKGERQPDPVVAPLVREGYAAIVAGASLTDVATLWNEAGAFGRGGNPWSGSLVSQFLRKPRNAGVREYGGKIIGPGTWEPLVEESLWQAAQTAMDNRPGGGRGRRRSVRRHLLTGVIFCGKCGHHLSGQWVKSKTGGKPGRPKAGQKKEPHPGEVNYRIAYTCKSCRGVTIRAHDIEPLLFKLIGKRLAQPDAVDLIKAEVHDADEAQRIRDEKSALYKKLDQLAVDYAQDLLDGSQVKTASNAIKGQIAALGLLEQDQERLRVFDGIPLGSDEAVAAVTSLSPDRFRAVLSVVCRVTVEPVGKGGSHTFNPERVKVEPL